jgi:hypothetical protein
LSLTNVTVTSATVTTLTGTSANITNISGTSLTVSTATLSGGTANGVLYLNGSKVATSGSALTFDGTNFATTGNLDFGTVGAKINFPTTSSVTKNYVGGAADGFSLEMVTQRGAIQPISYKQDYSVGHVWSLTGSGAMALTSTGLGIGTSSPSNKLHVNSGASTTAALIESTGTNVFTGLKNSGAVVYIGSDNNGSFLIQTPGSAFSTKMLVDTTGNVGIGTSSPGYKLDVVGAINASAASPTGFNHALRTTGVTTGRSQIYLNNTSGDLVLGIEGSTAGASYAGTAAYSAFAATTGANPFYVITNSAIRATFDSSGNLGIGTTSPSTIGVSGYTRLVLGTGSASTDGLTIVPSGTGGVQFTDAANVKKGYLQWDASTGALALGTAGTTKATLDASGNLIVGNTTANGKLDVYKGVSYNADAALYSAIGVNDGAVNNNKVYYWRTGLTGDANGQNYVFQTLARTESTWVERARISSDGTFRVKGAGTAGSTDAFLVDGAAPASAARITSGGDLLVGKTSTGDYVTGVELQPVGAVLAYRTNDLSAIFGRTNDGVIVRFTAASTIVGDISVSGGTVSYNAFAGSHWSQLQNGSRPDILRGTVMESINELCVWPDENNERLPKSKISDTVGSKKVYGVFMAWDNDWSETNDMYVTSVGAFICRVNGSVTVQEGDLLESNGDGTARVQADDIIRSSTIGKVTSTVKTHEYADGSYCVPTVLYCG